MSDIFVSYARSDRDRIAPLIQILESLGWQVWWDPKIPSGIEFDSEINQQLTAARCVLVAWTSASIESHWVRGEAREGLRRGIAVPVLLDAVQPPIDFRSIHTVDLCAWRGGGDDPMVAQLRDSIARILDQPPNPTGARDFERERAIQRRVRVFQWTSAALGIALATLLAVDFRGIGHTLDNWGSGIYAITSTRPLSSGMTRELSRRTEIIKTTLANQLVDYVSRRTADAWGASQILVSTAPNPAVDQRIFDTIIPSAYDGACLCWGPVDGGQHAAETAWTIMAHLSRGRTISPEIIGHLLDAQRSGGAWPLYFDALPESASSSTYATSLLALTL